MNHQMHTAMVWVHVAFIVALFIGIITGNLLIEQVDATPTAEETVFANGYLTPSVAADEAGNVYTMDTGPSFETVITKFNPEGTIVLQKSYTGISATGALTYDSTLRLILMINTAGRIVSITPDQLDVQEFASIDASKLVADQVFDIETGQTTAVAMNMAKFLGLSTFHTDASNFLIFVSGCTYPCTFGFVARIRFTNNRIQEGRVVVTSLASTIEGTGVSGPSPTPGVGVNNNGIVLTSMSFHEIPGVSLGAIEGIVAFGADFPENNARPPVLLFGRDASTAVASNTITTDSEGNFYVGTKLASALCGPLLVVSGATLNGNCFKLNPPLPNYFEDEFVRSGIAALSLNNERIVYLALMRILAVSPSELREGNILRVDLSGINLDASDALAPVGSATSSSSTASIVGGVIGGLLAVAFVVFAVIFYRRRQNQATDGSDKCVPGQVTHEPTNFQHQSHSNTSGHQAPSGIPMAAIVSQENRPSSPPALPPNKPKVYVPYPINMPPPIRSEDEKRLAAV